jgi:Copine
MSISRVTLHGPTNFAPIILHVAQFAAAAKLENTARVGAQIVISLDDRLRKALVKELVEILDFLFCIYVTSPIVS